MLQCPPQPTFCSSRWPTSIKLNADLLRRTLPPKQGRTQNGGPPVEIFFLPLGSSYKKFELDLVRAVALKYIGAFKPVISLNTMQNTARVEKTVFPKNCRFSIFGQSPISPTQDVKVYFNSSREDLKNAYLRSSLSASVLAKLALIASGGSWSPPTGYAPGMVELDTDRIYSPSTTNEWKISKNKR